MVGHGGSSAGSYLADPTSPIPSHCASIVVTSTVRVNLLHPCSVCLSPDLLSSCIEVCLAQHEALRQFVLSVTVAPWPGPGPHTNTPHLLCYVGSNILPGEQAYTLLVTETQV